MRIIPKDARGNASVFFQKQVHPGTYYVMCKTGLSGKLRVNIKGTCSEFNYPDVPQGVGGLQPRLGIAYNSQGGNGVAGFGADISGLSVITRAPRGIHHDGVDGAVYTPESDPFTSITLHGNRAGAWFEIKAPNGMTYNYGSATGRQVLTVNGAARAVSWRLDHVQDPMGNQMSYAASDNTLYLSSVTYGGNTGVATGLTNTVTFNYETDRT